MQTRDKPDDTRPVTRADTEINARLVALEAADAFLDSLSAGTGPRQPA